MKKINIFGIISLNARSCSQTLSHEKAGDFMSLFKKIIQPLTGSRDLQGPEVHKAFNEQPHLIQHLKSLSESHNPKIDVKKVETHLKLFKFGHSGERKVMYELEHSNLPVLILHDVHIEFEGQEAQIDFVLVSHKFIMVLEVKNYFGNMIVTGKGEFQRSVKGRIEGVYSPYNQAERHAALLERYLVSEKHIKKCPVRCAVAFSNEKTILDVSPSAPAHIQTNIIRHDQIKNFLENELKRESPLFMTDDSVFRIADAVLRAHKEKPFNREMYYLGEPTDQAATEADEGKPAVTQEEPVDLEAKLRAYRLQTSRDRKVKAYTIFTNKILEQLVEEKPVTEEELVKIEGVKQQNTLAYSDDILKIIKPYAVNPEQREIPEEQLRRVLKAFRMKHAIETNVKPYHVFYDKTMDQILKRRPQTIGELLEIEGIGEAKAAKFGNVLLEILKSGRF